MCERRSVMLLAVNVGNKNISFALFEKDVDEPISGFKISTDTKKTADEYVIIVKQLLDRSGIDTAQIDGAAASSVVPQINGVIKGVIAELIGKPPLWVGPGVKTGFAIKIDDPAELGADLVANASAVARKMSESGSASPALILDMGSVTTLFAMNKKGELAGGAILPGVSMSLDAMHRETAQLPNIELSGATRAIGKNTKESLSSGIILGYAAMIDGLIDRFEREIKCPSGEAVIFATGEDCKPVLGECSRKFHFDSSLTLKGLACIYKNTVG